jgi:hypothetical protein
MFYIVMAIALCVAHDANWYIGNFAKQYPPSDTNSQKCDDTFVN